MSNGDGMVKQPTETPNLFKHRINSKPLCEPRTFYESSKANDDKTNKNQVMGGREWEV